ncbi:MAG: hypothetical protein A3H63_02550 [Candidatus Harrisonbacteria bacterium RIFCSPLOWO2_02_FULL_45_10c]|uniref:Uncharacterized protein n=1 Tax=Candidatus Harrisonbacteria bacterium RIFCSPLOWO2_02_FULL_45_10c TaxID=1798410 RepID=A0A1G1ZSC0_9BACT|nr:MAG: hypothetical protein A3H63_02550 [Candidatus Harrisonbacteria bacterium RIFCSPLOWO2_02_FULL_45_10c]
MFKVSKYSKNWLFVLVTLTLVLLVNYALAAKLTSVSDTLSDSEPAVKSNHTIKFTLKSPITASSTIVIDFADQFQSTSTPTFDAGDFDIASSSVDLSIVDAGNCPGSGATAVFQLTSTSTANVFTFTHCNGTAEVADDAPVTVKIGTNATVGVTGDSQLVNPPSSGSYVISITAPAADSANTRVAIVPDVAVTASVATNFTFTVAGVASATTTANGEGGTTDVTTTATTIPWGEISSGTAKKARQDLTVSTNAKNGFSVTLWKDQNLTSADGSDIDNFQQTATSTAVAWSSPTADIDDENTWGWQGITSEDSTLTVGDTYGTASYSGIGSQSAPIEIFFHTGPANGVTVDKGRTKIGFKIEISALQEAANDYTQNLNYIATPTF